MRQRDFYRYKAGIQNMDKLQVIEFIGWQIVSADKSRIEYIPQDIKSTIDKHMLVDGTQLILWYELLGTNKPVYNKFPVSPSKRRKQTQGKLITQLSEYANITELKQRHYYAVWQTNTDTKTHGTDKPGYWYWTEIMEMSSDWAAHELFRFKNSIRFEDRDHPHPKELVIYIDELGAIDGPALYEFTMRKSNEMEPKEYHKIMGLLDYVTAADVISDRTLRFLKMMHRRGLLDRYL